jgi:hypothetical protein
VLIVREVVAVAVAVLLANVDNAFLRAAGTGDLEEGGGVRVLLVVLEVPVVVVIAAFFTETRTGPLIESRLLLRGRGEVDIMGFSFFLACRVICCWVICLLELLFFCCVSYFLSSNQSQRLSECIVYCALGVLRDAKMSDVKSNDLFNESFFPLIKKCVFFFHF